MSFFISFVVNIASGKQGQFQDSHKEGKMGAEG